MLSKKTTLRTNRPKQLYKKEQIKIHPIFDPKLKTNLGEIPGKNFLVKNELVRLTYKFVKLVTETSSKIQKLETYNEATNNLIYRNRWQKAVNKELQNLDICQTQYYTLLLDNQKTIGCKWMFRKKYNLDDFIEQYKVKLVPKILSSI